MMYKAPADVVEELVDDIQYYASTSAAAQPLEDRVEATGLALEELAALEAMGETPPTVELDRELIIASVCSLWGSELELATNAVHALLLTALGADWGADETLAAAVELETALLVRQRVSRRVRGARLAGVEAAVSEKMADAVALFDATIQPLAWAMSFANNVREGHALLVHPDHRRLHWWWTWCLDVEWDTIKRTDDVADLLERFPSFGNHLDEARAAARLRRG